MDECHPITTLVSAKKRSRSPHLHSHSSFHPLVLKYSKCRWIKSRPKVACWNSDLNYVKGIKFMSTTRVHVLSKYIPEWVVEVQGALLCPWPLFDLDNWNTWRHAIILLWPFQLIWTFHSLEAPAWAVWWWEGAVCANLKTNMDQFQFPCCSLKYIKCRWELPVNEAHWRVQHRLQLAG